MGHSYESEYWNGLQALAWKLFLKPELINLLVGWPSGGKLQDIVKERGPSLVKNYRRFPQPIDQAMKDLWKDVKDGKIEWQFRIPGSVNYQRGTTTEAALLEIDLNPQGIFAHPDDAAESSIQHQPGETLNAYQARSEMQTRRFLLFRSEHVKKPKAASNRFDIPPVETSTNSQSGVHEQPRARDGGSVNASGSLRISACIDWLKAAEQQKVQKKEALDSAARAKVPGLKQREFNAAYKTVFNRDRGRPRKSPK